ncbi:MAG: hypothetical protein RML40_02630 [Bacteroidota bacterium]|nr:hypothetical protein [Candidatus Kapabacteria bacterium]MDW8219406.1 hypothetical protein [Bacteroidota bacterium]
MTIVTHPTILNLRERRHQLIQRISDVVYEIYHLKTHILPEILEEYDRHFRDLEITLQVKTLAALDMVRREELFRLKLSRGEHLNEAMITSVHQIVDKEFERARSRLYEISTAINTDSKRRLDNYSEHNEHSNHSTNALTYLYRSIVKKIHPDTRPYHMPNDWSSQTISSTSKVAPLSLDQLWQLAQDAYRNCNLRELQAIYDVVCCTDMHQDSPSYTPNEQELAQEIIQLESRLHIQERRLHDITHTPPYTLRELMKSSTWIAKERATLQERIREKERDYERAKAFLLSIHAMRSDEPRLRNHSEEWSSDFIANTYFNNR